MLALQETEGKSNSASSPYVSTGECNGTFGELIQGILPNDRHFLVTLPIDLKSIVLFKSTENTNVVSNLPNKNKSIRAVERYLQLFGFPSGGELTFVSTFSAGKGLASSSADMVAAIRAAANYFHEQATPTLIESILRDIEPTDGVMYDGTVSFYHREVRLDENISATPRLAIVSADRGGECSTIEFNKRKRDVSLKTKYQYEAMLSSIKQAIRQNDMLEIGRMTTQSCEFSQLNNPHPHYDLMQRLSADTGALGLVATHSGTCLGLLYDRDDPEQSQKSSRALSTLISRDIECHHYFSV